MTEQPDYSGIAEMPVDEAVERLPDLVDQVLADDLFVYLTKDGKRVAVIMPTDIGEGYEQADDEYWSKRAREARPTRRRHEQEGSPNDRDNRGEGRVPHHGVASRARVDARDDPGPARRPR